MNLSGVGVGSRVAVGSGVIVAVAVAVQGCSVGVGLAAKAVSSAATVGSTVAVIPGFSAVFTVRLFPHTSPQALVTKLATIAVRRTDPISFLFIIIIFPLESFVPPTFPSGGLELENSLGCPKGQSSDIPLVLYYLQALRLKNKQADHAGNDQQNQAEAHKAGRAGRARIRNRCRCRLFGGRRQRRRVLRQDIHNPATV